MKCFFCGQPSINGVFADLQLCSECLNYYGAPDLKEDEEWELVIYAVDCDEDGSCPVCSIDFAECPCPGPTQDGYEYKDVGGAMYARRTRE